eukprot:m.180998 g.180998  ORF g.180998 m.180998 type:complete len:393 (+) comp32045_c0_seq2:318-1496(+)
MMGDGGDTPTDSKISSLYGDLEIREFTTPKTKVRSDVERYTKERKDFVMRYELLRSRAAAGFASDTTLGHLKLGRTIGEGSFGRVLLCRPSGVTCRAELINYMALKIQLKSAVSNNESEMEHVREERNLGFAFTCAYMTQLIDYFQDAKHIYFVFELCNAGELWSVIQASRNLRLNPKVAKFWAAQVAMALEYMHNLDVLFRDLKPENVLVSHAGHMKLTDFGFATRSNKASRVWTMCGTPEYMAPEILRGQGYSFEVDWWAFGILMYEMNNGNPPFEADSQVQLFQQISLSQVSFPKHFKPELVECVSMFLVNNPTDRMGYGKHEGMAKIRALPYFKSLPWKAMYEGTARSPYDPKVSGPGDVKNFDEYDEKPVKWYGNKDDGFGDTFTGF